MDTDWIYQERVDGDVFKVITQITGVLNTLLTGNLNVKFDISNQKSGLARGVVFFRQSWQDPPGERAQPRTPAIADPPNFAWNQYTWSTADAGDPAYDGMYTAFTLALNTGALPNGTVLSETQVKNARAVFTNMHEGPATLSMFYPTS